MMRAKTVSWTNVLRTYALHTYLLRTHVLGLCLVVGYSGWRDGSPAHAGEVTTHSEVLLQDTAEDKQQDKAKGKEKERSKPVKFRPILSSQYANFPVNWPGNHVYRLGLLRSAQEYDQVFSAAAFGGNQLPYAPAAKLYDKEMIIVISRVAAATGNPDKAIQIQSIIAKGKTLEVTFTFREGPKNDANTMKVTGAARIEKQDVDRVVFLEGQKTVGELKVDQGQWLLPEVATDETAQ